MLEKCIYSFLYLSDIKQSGGDMYGVNTYTFCAYTVNFWDSYSAFWNFYFKNFV